MAKQMYMDDAGTVALRTVEFLQAKLQEEFEKQLSEVEEDALFDQLLLQLEKLSNGDYRNYN